VVEYGVTGGIGDKLYQVIRELKGFVTGTGFERFTG
jgi:hypothetical protein